MSISTPFIRKPVATSLLMAAILLIGIAAYPLLPVAPLPRVEFPTIQVTAQYPGASPETMASTVAQPLERQFSQISGVSQMTSVSVNGNTQVVVQFDLDRSIDAASLDVQAAINNAGGSLPKNLPNPPLFRKVNPSDSPILILSVQSDILPLIDVDDYADNILSQQISQIAGVSQVSIGGEQKRSIHVQIDPARLAAMGMTLEDVRQLLVTATVDAPKGTIDGAKRSFAVYDNDQLTTPTGIDNVILAYRNGAPVRVKDVGHAVDGPENARLAGWQNGKRGIQLFIFKQPSANVIDTVERVKAALPALRAAIPPSIDVDTVVDRTITIRASLHEVQFTLLLSIALVVMVIFIFLRNFWATVIPSVTVPLALVGTFAVMYACGFSLNNLTLMASDHRGRLRRGRRHRHAGEHLPSYRGRYESDGGIAERRWRDRLHHHIHQPQPHRGVHPAAAHGRYRRPPVPRICNDRRDHRHRLRGRVPDPHADDVLALPQEPPRRPPRPAVPHRRGLFHRPAERISTYPRYRAPLPVHHIDGVLRHDGPDGLSLHHHAEGLLPAAGYRRHAGHDHCRARRLLRRDGPATDPDGRHRRP